MDKKFKTELKKSFWNETKDIIKQSFINSIATILVNIMMGLIFYGSYLYMMYKIDKSIEEFKSNTIGTIVEAKDYTVNTAIDLRDSTMEITEDLKDSVVNLKNKFLNKEGEN